MIQMEENLDIESLRQRLRRMDRSRTRGMAPGARQLAAGPLERKTGVYRGGPVIGCYRKFKSPLGNEPSRQTNFLSNLGAPGIPSHWTRLFF
jgi:hypothetical protein